jgi:hypothetical protein
MCVSVCVTPGTRLSVDAECGRGLTVVAALSTRWGCQRTGCRRKVVWSQLAYAR